MHLVVLLMLMMILNLPFMKLSLYIPGSALTILCMLFPLKPMEPHVPRNQDSQEVGTVIPILQMENIRFGEVALIARFVLQ